ncbi:YdcF family protein [Mucilaginibacter sp.]|uniref:YdcF family protein n=1 Tax=Mucilaginibacter sp. TaxID=1882438 RepID=UPI002630F056|nr:YdcF family protein [Mucilaginibacter sp.]MDB4922252.1 putative SAM-binding protein YcdF, family [Mucilaginibacter sp.]
MFFIFSKLLLIFILPFSWVIAFLLAALIVKKPHLKRRFFIISAVLLLIFSNPFLFNRFAYNWDIQPVPLKKSGSYSCVIVLGGFSGSDAKGNGFFNTSADRFIEGLKLISTGKASHILVSGGNGNLMAGSFRESTWAKTQLQLLKVPDSCIIVENKSRNTLENAAFSKVLLNKMHLQPPYLLVTSAFHMRRSLGIFKKEKMDVIPYPCNYLAGNVDFSFGEFVPDPWPLYGWNFYIKEVIGSAVNYFK